jgi:hypothetical protein
VLWGGRLEKGKRCPIIFDAADELRPSVDPQGICTVYTYEELPDVKGRSKLVSLGRLKTGHFGGGTFSNTVYKAVYNGGQFAGN